MSRRAPVLLAALLLLVGGCGKKAESEKANHAAEDAARKLTAAAGRALSKAEKLAERGRVKEAWAAWRTARDRLGQTPGVMEVADRIRKVEKAARYGPEYRKTIAALDADRNARTEEQRVKALEKGIAAGTAFLTNYPDSPDRDEIEAGIRYAKSERKLWTDCLFAYRKAKAALAAGKPEAALDSVRLALAKLDWPRARALETEALTALTPKGMVFIPSGVFPAGRDRENTYCAGFYIARYELTNDEYARFVKATGHRAPSDWKGGRPPAGEGRHPVVHVTLEDALAYAKWAKVRLPTELEWERAARGQKGLAYPWGNVWDPSKGNFAPGGTLPVGSKPLDRSPDGLFDMGGNVMELTLAKDDPTGKTKGPVIKGGHWSDAFHAAYALTFSRWPVDRDYQDAATGFRVAKSVPPRKK